jgi:lysophospholipase L1-like esterase
MRIVSRFIVPICMVFGGIFLAILALEAVLRIAGYDPVRSRFRSYAGKQEGIIRRSRIPGLDYDLTPNARRVAFGATVAINSHGFRDREYETEKRGKYRIIVLGDSLIFGLGTSIEEALPKRLESYLTKENPDIEVMNMGVIGYNIIDEAKFLENVGLQFSPDLLVLGICVNDAGIYSGELTLVSLLDRIERFPVNSSRVLQLLAINLADFKLPGIGGRDGQRSVENDLQRRYGIDPSTTGPDLVLDQLMGELRGIKLTPQKQNSMTSWYESKTHIGVLEKGLLQIKNLSDKHRFRVISVLFPYLGSENPDRWRIVYRIIEHEADKMGFDFIDVSSDFKHFGFESLQRLEFSSDGKLYRNSLHFNKLGHDVAAKKIADYIETKLPGHMERGHTRLR